MNPAAKPASIVSRLLTPFGSLGWKLTLSYTLVTAGALLVLELLLIAGIIIMIQSPSFVAGQMTQSLSLEATQLAIFLEQPINLPGLEMQMKLEQYSSLLDSEPFASETPPPLPPEVQYLVVDTQGHLLAGYPTVTDGIGQPLDMQRYPDLTDPLAAALVGDNDSDHLYSLTSDRLLQVAVPIRRVPPASPVLGAYIYIGPFSADPQATKSLLNLLGLSLVCFTSSAAVLGAIFGFFTSRNLARRLSVISGAASAWGHGNFAQSLSDSSGDEIGQLGRHLNQMAAQLETLLADRQALATLEERNRLARDLHDSVKQQTFAVSMNLGAVQELWERDPVAARQRLDTAASIAHQSQAELTALIQTLRPVQLEGKGLAQALNEHILSWERQTGIKVDIQINITGPFPLSVEQTLFRVTQEALSNVAKHSQASHLMLALRQSTDNLELEINDNGHGFDLHQPASGMGLTSMHERLHALAGSLEIESTPQGTRLLARLPASPKSNIEKTR